MCRRCTEKFQVLPTQTDYVVVVQKVGQFEKREIIRLIKCKKVESQEEHVALTPCIALSGVSVSGSGFRGTRIVVTP